MVGVLHQHGPVAPRQARCALNEIPPGDYWAIARAGTTGAGPVGYAVSRIQVGGDGPQEIVAPGAGADIQQAGAGGVAPLHVRAPGEPERQVVVRQEYRRQAGVLVRLVLLEPQDLRCREPGRDPVAKQLDGARKAAEAANQRVALGRGRRNSEITLVSSSQPLTT